MYQNSIQTSPHLSIAKKLNGKKSAYDKKFGSPKLRDMLREVYFTIEQFSKTYFLLYFSIPKLEMSIAYQRISM